MTAWTKLINEIEGFSNEIRNLPVSQHVTPTQIRSELKRRYNFDKPIPLETLTADISRLLRNWNLHVTHPRYFGLFNPSVRQAGIVADALVALYNPKLAVWSHAPVANEIEQMTLSIFTEALEQQIEADRQAGLLPFMVVGTAGTTGAGLVDPLPQIADVANRFGLWFHVDAAWGGSAVLSPRLRSVLRGIEDSDSVTWDAHKWLSVPMGAGMFFCRHPEAVKQAFAITTSYMPDETGDNTVDPYATTAQWSRRLMGLKVFMALAELGLEGYSKQIEYQADLGDHLRRRLKQAGWLIRNETSLPVVCFSHPDINDGTISTGKILEEIYARGKVWISDVVLGGKERVLRACITSFPKIKSTQRRKSE